MPIKSWIVQIAKVFVLILLLPSIGRAQVAIPESASATLSPTQVPARGKQQSLLTINRFGRYAIIVRSRQGVALQLVDRMAGPRETAGVAGERDGRLDLILDRGTYKILTYGSEKGAGAAIVEVHAFAERSEPRPPQLVEFKQLQDRLEDFEQRSYWIQITKRRAVSMEAAGRYLTDLRLWKDGEWLVDATPRVATLPARTGQPLLNCILTAELNPGLYLLTAYGGEPRPWSVDSKDAPFYLRFGIPTLPDALRRRYTLSPLGVDRWVVPGKANYYRLELNEAAPAAMQVGWMNPEQPFANGAIASIEKKSLVPVAELDAGADSARAHLVTITGEPGLPYILQHFELKDFYTFSRDGAHWVSSLHSGHASDSVDATGIVVQFDHRGAAAPIPAFVQVIGIDSSQGWSRKFNLMETLTLFLEVKQTGKYEVGGEGVQARYRLEPFLINRPSNYRSPDFRAGGSPWELDKGYYVLTVEPVKKGILTLTIKPSGVFQNILEAVGLNHSDAAPVRGAVRFENVKLNLDYTYALYLNRQPEVKAGMILRALPMDLSEPLYLSLQPGETATIQIVEPEDGVVKATAEDGSLMQVAEGVDWKTQLSIRPGPHTLHVRNTGQATAGVSVAFAATRLLPETPLPPLPDTALAAIPNFPALTETTPQYFDLDRHAAATFVLRADKPALYQLESAGLLATSGNLRTRTVTALFQEQQNGVGRNFLIQQYLREGDYQVTVESQGESTGHLGVALMRTPLRDAGSLLCGLPARISLHRGEAAFYRFHVEKGRYKLHAFGQNGASLVRLEDEDGWPILAPGIQADLETDLDAGNYRLVLLPGPIDSRRITLLTRIEPPVKLTGHGPHRLPLAVTLEHEWLETPAGQPRKPDAWLVSIPADADARIQLDNEMQADLIVTHADGSSEKVAYIPPQRGWSGRLTKGEYRLEVTCVRINNHANYRISIAPDQLVAGLDRPIQTPVVIPVSAGDTGLVEFTSFGSEDVRAMLRDPSGRTIASNDDRPDDWNFHVTASLNPGFYSLEVQPVGKETAGVTVSMNRREEKLEQALTLPAKLHVVPGESVRMYPLTSLVDSQMLLFQSDSAETVGASIEVRDGEAWRTVGSRAGHSIRLEIPIARPVSHYRLRLWSVDQRGVAVSLQIAAVTLTFGSEEDLALGMAATAVPDLSTSLRIAAAGVAAPGLFRMPRSLRVCTRMEAPCEAPAHGFAAVTDRIWIVTEAPVQKAQRVRLPSGTSGVPILLTQSPAVVDLVSPELGPVVVIARSTSGQPGVAVVESEAASEARANRMAVASQSAVTVALNSDHPSVQAWQADAGDPIDAELRHLSYAPPQSLTAEWGSLQTEQRNISAITFDLPQGHKILRLALGENTVAAVVDGGQLQSVHWMGGTAFLETLHTDAPRLLLLHTTVGVDHSAFDVLPDLAGHVMTLSASQPFEQVMEDAGVVRIPCSAPEAPAMLRIRGAAKEAWFISNSGLIQRGTNVSLATAGTLIISYEPGLLLGWMESDGHPGLWDAADADTFESVTLPSSLTLHGNSQSLQFHTSAPAVLHVRIPQSVVSRLEYEGREAVVELHEKQCNLDVYSESGTIRLRLRAVAGATLSGIATITTTPVVPVTEGLGPEVLLAPGATRMFSFHIETERPIGVGAYSDSGNVEIQVLDIQGHSLGKGALQMLTLKPGTYLLSLHAPSNSPPLLARPAIAGLALPDNGPPQDVIRQYIRMEHPATPATDIPLTSPR